MTKVVSVAPLTRPMLPAAPPRSRLYHLAPLGIGTPFVESLTGYIGRLAAAHAVQVTSLAAAEIFPLVDGTYLHDPARNSRSAFWAQTAHGINGPGRLAENWIRALETLTLRRDLSALTLRPWAAVLPKQGLLRKGAAWCPDCLEGWHDGDDGMCHALLWSFATVTICAQHRRHLAEQCPGSDCRRTQPPLPHRTPRGYCIHCGGWLGASASPPNVARVSPDKVEIAWQDWATTELGRLLAAAPTLSAPPTRAGLTATLAEHIARRGGAAAFGRQMEVACVTVTQWQHGKYIPELPLLLRVCHELGVAPLTMLAQVSVRATPMLWSAPPGRGAAKPGKRRTNDLERAGRMLEDVLAAGEDPPPSLCQVAQRLEYRRSQLCIAFPALTSAISARYLEHQRALALRRTEHRRNEVRRVVLALHEQGLYPSSTRVAKLLHPPVHFRHPEVVAAWQALMRELGAQRQMKS